MDPRGLVCPHSNIHVYNHIYENFFSETAWPIKVKFHRKRLKELGTNVFFNNPGHMTKMATMPIQGKNPSKIFFSGTAESIAMKFWTIVLYSIAMKFGTREL